MFEWKDITNEFKDSLSDIQLGKLIHLENFDLNDAMVAIPIMDSRVDTGTEIASAQERNKWDSIPDLNLFQIIGSMDSIINLNMNFMDGKSAVESLFSSIFVTKVDQLSNPIMKTFVQLFLQISRIQRMVIMEAQITFQEDFLLDLGTFSLDSALPDFKIIDELQDCIQSGDFNLNSFAIHLDIETDLKVVEECLVAILARLTFAKEMFYLVSGMHEQNIDFLKKQLPIVQELMKTINDTSSLGSDMTASVDVMTHRSLFANIQLQPVKLNIAKSISQLSNMIISVNGAVSLISNCSITTICCDLNHFSYQFPEANIFVRSFLYSNLIEDQKFLGKDISVSIRNSIVSFFATSTLFEAENEEVVRICSDVLLQLQDLLGNTIKVMCANRSRQRRQLFHLLNQYNEIQVGLVNVESYATKTANPNGICRLHIYRWVFFYKLYLQLHVFQMGFDLQLYSNYEFKMIYCYSNYIANNFMGLIQSIKEERLSVEFSKLSLQNRKVSFFDETELYVKYLQVMNILSLKICIFWSRINQKPSQIPSFLNPRVIYKQRFLKVSHFQAPSYLKFNEYEKMISELETCDIDVLISSILETIDEIKVVVDPLKKQCPNMTQTLMNSVRTGVANRLVITTTDWTQKDLEITLDFKYHPWFPIITKKKIS